MKRKNISLTSYINSLQANGQYTFTRGEALAALGTTPEAFRYAALRLMRKNRLAKPVHGFYIIVPVEYHTTGGPPAVWFIDQLMKFYRQPYYIALLTAAAYHGAAHQQAQVFQVMTDKPIRNLVIGRNRLQFFTKKEILLSNYQQLKTPVGYMFVSTPEVTALDLVHYLKASGHIHHVATVLAELHEELNTEKLASLLTTQNIEAPCVQRLGYLLELVTAKPELIQVLKEWVQIHKPRYVALRSDKEYQKDHKNTEWRLYINEIVEPDEI